MSVVDEMMTTNEGRAHLSAAHAVVDAAALVEYVMYRRNISEQQLASLMGTDEAHVRSLLERLYENKVDVGLLGHILSYLGGQISMQVCFDDGEVISLDQRLERKSRN